VDGPDRSDDGAAALLLLAREKIWRLGIARAMKLLRLPMSR
jgi:hypothetical protein